MTHWDSPRGRHSTWDDEGPRDGDPSGPETLAQQWQAYEAGRVRPTSPGPAPAPPHRPVSPAGPAHRPVSPGPARPSSPAPWFGARDGAANRPTSGGGRPTSGPPAGVGRPTTAPPAGTRSRWVDERGFDHQGRLVLDLDEIDDPESDPPVRRRWALVALGSVIAGAAAGFAPEELRWAKGFLGDEATTRTDAADTDSQATSRDTLPGDGSTRPGGNQPSTVSTYPEQNSSYVGSAAGDQIRRNTPQKGRVLSGPAKAAAAPKPIPLSALGDDPVLHLASRLTFGATPRLVADITKMGIDQWVAWQLDPARIADTRAETKLKELTTLGKSIEQLRAERDANNTRNIHPEHEWVEATIARQIWSDRQLLEVMVDFWNDFLHVAASFDNNEMVRASFDRDVIRRYALDNYPDMFVAANRHPALLRYLDQDQSRRNAVNENLARENLELYTVGVDGGYTERDVRQAALLQTGRSIRDDQYVYRPDQHFVGPIQVMGFTHENATADGGEAASEAYFRYLAMHPSTAKYIAMNLCTRLVSDTPPASLVDAVAASYLAHKGQIKPTLITLLSSTQFWGSVGQKVRRPGEYLVATYRALGVQADTPAGFKNDDPNASPFLRGLRQIRQKLEQLGHSPAGQPTPNGYPDVFVAWTSAGTMVNLWNEALSIIDGARPMFTYVAPEQLLGTKPPATAGAYVDALFARLVNRKITAKQRDLLLGVAGMTATKPVDASMGGAVRAVARTILASPQHQLR